MVPTGLYLHIPFCAVKCRFCDFAAYPGRREDTARYLNALRRELAGISRLKGGEQNDSDLVDDSSRSTGFFGVPRRVLETFYVGGGTPSLLEPAQWQGLLGGVRECFDISADWEATLECNPDGVSLDKLKAWRESGMNRLSFGLQTDEGPLLSVLGRTHTFEDFKDVFHAARTQGFDNLNVDLMFGLPGQTFDGWVKTLERVIELSPEHLSAYALHVEESTYFHRSGVQSDDDLQADMYELTADLLESAGYVHYEISNFAHPGFECRHNLRYWRNQECLGAGTSSAGYDGIRRRTNTDDLSIYLSSVEKNGVPDSESLELSPAQREGENLMLGLRLKEGALLTPAGQALYGKSLDRHVRDGLLNRKGDRYYPTRKGWRLSNRIFVDLLGG
ncbi:MAG: radical SAM family heme chaperone HemW [Elusimicrobia bacterium]|nr:radical SAM family heme chaperone HemW [Elusimicrobiota bacterium]